MPGKRGSTRARIFDAVPELRKLLGRFPTTAEISEHIELSVKAVAACIRRMRREHPRMIYVYAWARRIGCQGRECARWAVGNRADAPRPRFGIEAKRERNARYRANHRAEIRTSTRRKRGSRSNPFRQLLDLCHK